MKSEIINDALIIASTSDTVKEVIAEWILPIIAIIAISYGLIALRKVHSAYKKLDYLLEDLTYKSEMLNPVIDNITKINRYYNIFEAATKTKAKSIIKVIHQNRHFGYKVWDLAKNFANNQLKVSESDTKSPVNSKIRKSPTRSKKQIGSKK